MTKPPPRGDARRALLHAAKRALEQGKPAHARHLLAEPLRAAPSDPAILALAGIAARATGDPLGASALLERAVRLAPQLDPARMALAETLVEIHRLPEAIAVLDGLKGDNRSALLLRASALGQLGDQEAEVETLERLLDRDPTDIAARLRLGHACRALGNSGQAQTHYRTILKQSPYHGAAWWSLANLKAAEVEDADRRAMRAALKSPKLPDPDRIRILFALARAEELAKRFADSFHLYAEANALRRASSTYDPARLEKRLAASTELFTTKFFAARPDHGCLSDAPIFIIGMQRSGSTLLEQMLASHDAVEGTAELPYIAQIARELQREANEAGKSYEVFLASLDARRTRALGQSYLERVAPHRRTARPYFLDKMPTNWAQLGLIRLILPRARVIDVRRNPMACGFSNYRQFYARGVEHSYSLEDWGRHYALYVEHMAQWDWVLPGWVTRLIYERLVDNPEKELRSLMTALGMKFESAMLDFHRNARTVRTISAQQVRRPLSRDALDEWRAFEPWLGSLTAALGPALDDWEGPR